MAEGFIASRDEIGLKRTSSKTSVPAYPKAKLMYYFKCVCSVLELRNLARFTNYSNFHNLSEEDTDALLKLIVFFSPDELIGKVFFQSDELCVNYTNEFYELEKISHIFGVTDSVLIGGQTKRVVKIMTFKRVWLENNYLEPFRFYAHRLSRIALGLPGYEPPRRIMITSRACLIQ